MIDSKELRLPIVSESQRIGRLANKAFTANAPNAWLYDSIDGDNDFGYDYQIQVETAGLISASFRLQLKGTTAPALNAAGTKFSISLDVATVNYYARATEPVLLVLCDLSVDIEHPKNCPLYHQWIQDDLQRIRYRGVSDGQESVTFHIPVANRLTDSTDLTNDIDRFRRLTKIGEQLDVVVQQDHVTLSPVERSTFVSKLVPGLAQRSPALFDALVEEPTTSWVEAPKDTLQWHLREAVIALRSGDTEGAQEAILAAEKLLAHAKPLEQADYWHALGRLHSQMLDEVGARSAFEQACRLSNDAPRYLVPWAETDLRLRFEIDGPNDFSAAINRLKSSEALVVGMRARLIAAEGRYADALAVAKTIQGPEGAVARAIILAMQGSNDEAVTACDSGLSMPNLRESTKLLFLILRARGRFAQAIGMTSFDGPTTELPMSGPAGTQAEFLHLAWKDIVATIPMLRVSRWPANVEIMSDIWAASASMLGLQLATLPIMAEAAAARSTFNTLQAGVESLAAQVGQFDLALEANARQGTGDEVIFRRIGLLHLAGQHKDCVELMAAREEALPTAHKMYGYAMTSAILSADRIIRFPDAVRWEQKLESLRQHAPNLALARFFRTISQNLLARDSALAELERQYEMLGRPQVIAMQLFHELDATDKAQATRCVTLAEQLSAKRLLDTQDFIHLAQSLATLGWWDRLLELSDQATSRFEHSDQLTAVGALALDNLGRTAEARGRLKQLIEKPDPDALAMSSYIAIASRSGFTDEAVACIERVLASEQRPDKQLECLRHLFALLHLSEPDNPRLVDIAWEIGKRTDRSDEAQEGLFLMSIFAATLSADTPLDDSRKTEIQQRLEAFVRLFPESKILKRATLPDNATPDQMMRMIRTVIGETDKQLQWRRKIETELQQGVAPIPYAWRPRHILGGVSDLVTLWELSKRSRWDDRQLHLTMVGTQWKPIPFTKMRGNTPLLDLTALLVVFDLGLLDAIFQLFPRIAISKATLFELQQLRSPMSGSSIRQKLINLQNGLKAHFQFIEQPGVEAQDGSSMKTLCWSSEETAEAAKSMSYMLYADDALFRIYADVPKNNPLPICTLDVLLALDEAGILSAQQVSRHLATLTLWRVSLVIPVRYQLAILPDKLGSIADIEEGINILRSDALCIAMFNGLWDPRKSYEELQAHGGALLRQLVSNLDNRIESIAALAALWLGKARLHRQAPMPVERVISRLIIQATIDENPVIENVSRRLWSIQRALVEFVYGDNMDDDRYHYAIKVTAQVAAEVDQHHNLKSDRSMQMRLSQGLTGGTSDADYFAAAYNDAIAGLAQKQPRSR